MFETSFVQAVVKEEFKIVNLQIIRHITLYVILDLVCDDLRASILNFIDTVMLYSVIYLEYKCFTEVFLVVVKS